MAMKISLLEIHDFKRLSSVTIEPGERSLILVGGNNTQGKSSLLGAMGAALGGKREIPDDPIRHGAKKASIRVVFDDGELIVRRKFSSKGTSLEVSGANGKISSPQKMLDQLVGSRFIDPMKFSRLSAIEQRKVLLGCVDLGIDLDASMDQEKVAYNERRDINRDIKRLESQIEGMSNEEIPQKRDAKSLIAKIDNLNDTALAASDANRKIATAEEALLALTKTLEDSQKAFIQARNDVMEAKKQTEEHLPNLKDEIIDLRKTADIDVSNELTDAKEDLASCSEHNAMVAKLQADKGQLDKLEETLDASKSVADDLTTEIERAKADRADALEDAKMPIPGLSLDEDGLVLNGAPFGQASGAEKLRASIAISWALKPDLCDIWVEDGALLDETSLAMVEVFAEENGLRIWLERVGEGDADAIIMVDGKVQES